MKNKRPIATWEIDELAMKLDPGAFLDDSVVIGSVEGRRARARDEAAKTLTNKIASLE